MHRLQPAALLLPVLLFAGVGPVWSDICAAADHELWEKLLDAALVKTQEARSLIEQTAAEPPSEPIGRLAEILLEEWNLPADAEDLQQPRIVYSPEPDFSDLWDDGLALEYFNVVVSGLVTSSGTVEEPEVNTSVGAPEVDRRCLEAFSRWCYRPARGDCGYVRKKTGAVCHINPREVASEPTGGQAGPGVTDEPVRQDRQPH